ncbi:YafY family protein [Albimonas sp. CAU 1670]|uniref:helix-turn-helix transcriptional regulator n=1 Tax=Albimonas sp. CAU 1670 TaxID=3032599 RepID=UPI0023D9EBD1|nr:YafY family protein [Albimonas sp. CAU 1670]MDF2235500.1 YafY family protein [Albimonas sp. CAU 1670]
MRRADRLFELVTLLRGRRFAVTGRQLAEALEVSLRTVYRDVADLQAQGVPISGEAGVGYRLSPDFDLPPLMFDRHEVLALLVGGRLVQAVTDPALAAAARSAEAKIRAILDDRLLAEADALPYRAPVIPSDDAMRLRHQAIREACEARLKLHLDYRDAAGEASSRIVWPLGLIAWTGRWTLLAWCETREAYRNFRFDRIEAMRTLTEVFPQRPDRSLAHFLETVDGR